MVYLSVGSAVVAVDVAEHRRCGEEVIHGCIEDGPHLVVIGLDGDAREFAVPCLVGFADDAVEVPVVGLSEHVGLGTFDGDGRQCRLDNQLVVALLSLWSDEGEGVVAALQDVDRFGEGHGEEGVAVGSPSCGASVAGDECRRLLGVVAFGHLVPSDALCEVESEQEGVREVNVATRDGGELVHGDTLCGGELDSDVGLPQVYAVVTWFHVLVVVGEDHVVLVGIGDGQQCDVAEASDSRSAEVHGSEADEHGVAVVISRAPVPSACVLAGSYLYESRRHVGSHEYVSVAARSDTLVNEHGEVLLPC